MDLREYDYITERSDTLPEGALKSIQKILTDAGSDSTPLIDVVLKGGYIEPPSGYKWQGCYKVTLAHPQIETIFRELIRAEGMAEADPKEQKRIKRFVACWSRVLHETPESYESYKSRQAYFDLRGMSFGAFADLIFDHPVADKSRESKQWYWSLPIERWIDWDKTEVVELYGELFLRSDELHTRYSKAQLEQGFWFLMGSSLEFTPDELIRDDELSIALKEKLIKSMYFLYEKCFYAEPLETSCYMWWDSYSRIPGLKDPTGRIQEAIFETLVRILALDSEICQLAALHGMNHLGHPDTEKVIGEFIRKNRELTLEQIDYAKKCITGDIL